MLRGGELDAALVSVTEVLFHDGYDILDGVAVASRGAVKSVYLAHRQPLEEIETIHCDPTLGHKSCGLVSAKYKLLMRIHASETIHGDPPLRSQKLWFGLDQIHRAHF